MQILRRLPYVSLIIASFLYFAPFLRVLSHNGDEGTLITGAARVAEGQVPFRDFFEVMGPGTFYWLAFFFKLLGTNWLATRICLLFTTTLISILIFYLARRLYRGTEIICVVFFVSVSFHSWNAISHHMDSNLFGLVSFAALVLWIDRRHDSLLLLAGIFAGLTTWFMLPKGLLLFLSFALYLWTQKRKGSGFWRLVAILFGGYFLINTVVGALFWRAGALSDVVYANLIWPLTNYSGINRVPYGLEFRELYWSAFTTSLGAVSPPLVTWGISALLSVPFIVVLGLPLILAAFAVLHPRAAFDHASLPYWLAGSAFWLAEMHRKDLFHIVYGSPILIVLTLYFCFKFPSTYTLRAVRFLTACAVVLAVLSPLVALAANTPILTRRGVVHAYGKSPVLTYLNAEVSPGEPLFVYPYAPMYYFLSGATNATHFSILMYEMNTESQFRDVIRSLEEKKVRSVIWDRSFPEWVNRNFPAYRIPREDRLIIEPYLMEHYYVVGEDQGYQLLRRKVSGVDPILRAPIQGLAQ